MEGENSQPLHKQLSSHVKDTIVYYNARSLLPKFDEGRAPEGGEAPERGNPPEGGVATLPTTLSAADCGDRGP